MKNNDQKLIWEAYLTEDSFDCPAPTQDVETNTKNRDAAIAADHIKYGPLNVRDVLIVLHSTFHLKC